MNVLHVLNYAWPYIDGYTARSIGLTQAQAEHLDGVQPCVATSPFTPLAHGRDRHFSTALWGSGAQLQATRFQGGEPLGVRTWERPAMGFSPATSAMFADELRSIVRRMHVQLIHVHHPHYVANVALQTGAELGIPVVYELRCFNGYYDLGTINPYRTLRGHWQNHAEFALARRASAVVTISDGLANALTRRGVDAQRLFVVRNSVDTARFFPRAAASRLDDYATRRATQSQRTSGQRGERLNLKVGYATTFETMENLDSAVKAAVEAHRVLAAEGIDLHLSIAGTGRDWQRIHDLVVQLDASEYVQLPGLVPYGQMPDFYHSLDLFLVPRGDSLVATDTTPLKPLEALACGLPLLVTELPAMRELLGNREDVRFTRVDAAGMAGELVAFARQPWRGTAEIEERSWASEVQKYHTVYEQALAFGAPQRFGTLRLHRWLRARVQPVRELTRTRRDGQSTPLHVVVCGFPRTGSTLLQVMAQNCLDGVRTFEGEVEALDVIAAFGSGRRLLTKCPDDVLHVDAIRERYRNEPGADVAFVLTVRDPRDILTSRHAAYTRKRGYYVTPERFARCWNALQALRDQHGIHCVRYESLAGDPASAERLFTETFGWQAHTRFARFHEPASQSAQDSMTEGALGGLRALSTDSLSRWREPVHDDRMREVLDQLPQLVAVCIELGYETDDRWTEPYLQMPRTGATHG